MRVATSVVSGGRRRGGVVVVSVMVIQAAENDMHHFTGFIDFPEINRGSLLIPIEINRDPY